MRRSQLLKLWFWATIFCWSTAFGAAILIAMMQPAGAVIGGGVIVMQPKRPASAPQQPASQPKSIFGPRA